MVKFELIFDWEQERDQSTSLQWNTTSFGKLPDFPRRERPSDVIFALSHVWQEAPDIPNHISPCVGDLRETADDSSSPAASAASVPRTGSCIQETEHRRIGGCVDGWTRGGMEGWVMKREEGRRTLYDGRMFGWWFNG